MPTNWGNYRDYHGPASAFPGSAPSMHIHDVRLSLLKTMIPESFDGTKDFLDLGSNAGNVSCQVAFDFDAGSVTGVDIDPKLVSQAENLLAIRSSRVRADTNMSERAVDYFPMSAILKHGYRFEPQSKATGGHSASTPALAKWPRVRFVSEDWAISANPATSGPYHVILALSVIKWIHLEHLDEGLVTFFGKCASSLTPGGYLVIELQPWDSYEKAIRPNHSPHFKGNLNKLKFRPEAFADLLKARGLTLYATSESLPRRIDVFVKA